MSSICGALYLDGKPITKNKIISMMENLSIHASDRSLVWNENNIFMGCNIQFTTLESKNEIIPKKDYTTGLSITADAIIDNREELFSLLSIPSEQRKIITDSELILKAYIKLGKECPNYITGDYAFAIWDQYKQELFCARDHVGKRTFYYYHDSDTFIFSTLMKPIYSFLNKKPNLNERWMADYLGLFGVIHELECNDTIYENIYQLPPATTLTFNSKGITKKNYWNPLSVKQLKFKHDYEYKEAFLEIFSKAIKARLRSDGEIGIFISGGLDSSSIGALAAKELASLNKELKGYHSIPIKKYNNSLSKYWIANESEYIDELVKMYPNINVEYISCEDKNSYSDMDYLTTVLEHPYKPVVNFYWIHEIFNRASKNGCKIILDGQYGNFSISYGSFMTNIYELLIRGKFHSIHREITAFSTLHNLNRNYVLKRTIEAFLPRFYHKTTSNYGNNFSLINPDLADKWRVYERINSAFGSKNLFGVESINHARNFYANPSFFSHLGSLETKMGLATGVTNRDPTRDKSVIEFCSSIPWHQFVHNGQERYFIRKAMEGIIPEKIRCNYTVRGKQGVDWIQRILPFWEEIKEDLYNMLSDTIIESYINVPQLKQQLSQIDDIRDIKIQQKHSLDLKNLFICLVFYNYIKLTNH